MTINERPLTRRQQKRERVRAGLALRRIRRGWRCDARQARLDADYARYVERLAERLAEHCRCCEDCCYRPCEGVLAGGFCDMACDCDRDRDRHELDEPEFDDERDDWEES